MRNARENSREKANVTELEEEEPHLIRFGSHRRVCGAAIEQRAKLWWVLLSKESLERERQTCIKTARERDGERLRER